MRAPRTSVAVARLIYFILCQLAGISIALGTSSIPLWVGLVAGVVIALFFIFVEILTKDFSLRGFSTATFGIAVGLICAFLITRTQIPELLQRIATDSDNPDLGEALALGFNVIVYATLGFIGAVLALRSDQEEFSFIIPYVRFRQDSASGQPMILDSEVIMDGRLPSLIKTGFLTGRILVPQFVFDELQVMANSPAAGKRQRGQRGLEILGDLQQNPNVQISILDSRGMAEDESMAARLIKVAKLNSGRLISTDENLTKAANLQGTDIINLDNLAEALRPAVVVGENLRLALVRTGKDEHQAVGYMPDGTMIVVNHAVDKIGTSQNVTLISKLQTNAGLMIFAELDTGESE